MECRVAILRAAFDLKVTWNHWADNRLNGLRGAEHPGFPERGHDDSECGQAPGRADSRMSLGAISREVVQDWGKESWRKVVTESLGNHRVIPWSLVLGGMNNNVFQT